jgi:nicotinate dehydrogenase subunit B
MAIPTFSRRDVLRTGSALVVSFALRGRSPAQTAPANVTPGKPLDVREVDSFLAVRPDGTLEVYCGKVDLGTGLRVAVRQMAAEELNLPFEKVVLIEGDTGLTPDQGSTGGSTGLTRGGVEVRRAAATARQALIALGADQLKRPASELVLADGQVRPASGGTGVPVAMLIGGKRFSMKVDEKSPLKDPSTYTIVGKALPRPDVPAKCTGKHVYMQDFSVQGMLHGRVIRPPAIGAKLQSVDESSIRAIPDVKVIRTESFLGVVAKDEWAAIRASRELKATWSDWEGLPANAGLEQYLRGGSIERNETVVNRGDPAVGMPTATRKFSGTFFWPNQSHGSIGPSCAVADVRANGTTVWSASQGPHALRVNLAKVFGIPEAQMRVIYLDGAGCYGTNGHDDVAADAVLLSKAVGAPVRVQWMRQEELGWDPKGPQQLLDVRAGTDNDGGIVAWETQMWLPVTKPGARPLLSVDAAAMNQDRGQGAGLLSQNGDPPYAASNVRVTAHWLKDTPLRPSNLRAPGKIANVFAVESIVDEIAVAAGIDPVQYRLRGLSDDRAVTVIKRVAEMSDWQTRVSPNKQAAQGNLRVGRGIAYARYKQAENYVAIVMDVGVEPATGKIHVRRVWCAHDCAMVVNPDALKNQIEGCIMQTLSRTLHEEVKFDKSRVTSVDWIGYPILRMDEAPLIDVALINHPELPLLGAGEAAAAPVAAALANAVFDATGVRLRTVPFTAARVKAVLSA